MEDTGDVNIQEFVHGMMRLKGAAKGVDVATLLYEHKRVVKKLDSFTVSVKECFEDVLSVLMPEEEPANPSSSTQQGNAVEYVDRLTQLTQESFKSDVIDRLGSEITI